MKFHAVEIIIIGIILALFGAATLLFAGRNITVDYPRYGLMVLTGLALIGVGQAYRLAKRNDGIALACTTAGLFILFTISGSIFNYGLLPLDRPSIDPELAALDAFLGF